MGLWATLIFQFLPIQTWVESELPWRVGGSRTFQSKRQKCQKTEKTVCQNERMDLETAAAVRGRGVESSLRLTLGLLYWQLLRLSPPCDHWFVLLFLHPAPSQDKQQWLRIHLPKRSGSLAPCDNAYRLQISWWKQVLSGSHNILLTSIGSHIWNASWVW